MKDRTHARTALIADDDEIARLLMCETVAQTGIAVVAVADGAAALAAARERDFDLMLLDVEMPHLDGHRVCEAVRALPRHRHTPIVMITGRDDAASVARSFEVGATDFIAKPINWSLIPHRLRYVVRNAEAEQRLRELAYRDPLTGLPNHRAFSELAAEALAASQPEALAILSIDVPVCARIVDTFGHEAGDAALRAFATRLETVVAQYAAAGVSGRIARFDADRFAICLHARAGVAPAEELAAGIAAALDQAVQCGQHTLFLRPVIGIARFPEHGGDVATLLTHADTARQRASASGGHEPVTYAAEMGERARARLELDAELRRAVREERLELHYQPKVRIADGALVGFEALLRWPRDGHDAVPPGEFIPLAEESGLIVELGDWVIQAAFRQLALWRAAGLDTTLAVNVSGRQFEHGDPARVIAAAAADTGIPPSRLIVEVTESMLLADADSIQIGLTTVRALGCRVAVDDFGTGYSSLAYLRGLPIDELKVDRAFVEHVHEHEADAAIYTAVLSIARSLGLVVTAEGVETSQQLDWLRTHDCGTAQGYLIARPMPGHEAQRRYATPGAAVGQQVA